MQKIELNIPTAEEAARKCRWARIHQGTKTSRTCFYED